MPFSVILCTLGSQPQFLPNSGSFVRFIDSGFVISTPFLVIGNPHGPDRFDSRPPAHQWVFALPTKSLSPTYPLGILSIFPDPSIQWRLLSAALPAGRGKLFDAGTLSAPPVVHAKEKGVRPSISRHRRRKLLCESSGQFKRDGRQ